MSMNKWDGAGVFTLNSSEPCRAGVQGEELRGKGRNIMWKVLQAPPPPSPTAALLLPVLYMGIIEDFT